MALRVKRPLGLRKISAEERLSMVEHLDELRNRIIISVAALVLAFIGMYLINEQLLDALTWPLPEDQQDQLLTLSPTEPLFTVLKVCFYSAVLVALPIWLYQLYAFVIPAVQDQPRKIMLTVVAGISSLFAAGVAFGYFVVLPVALPFLLNFGGDAFNTQLRAGEYFGFATTMLLGAGLIFELPAAMTGLARLGVVTAAQFRSNWRAAIVVIAIVAAILPGGDPLSMLLLMIPQIFLYQLGIWLAGAFGGPPLWQRDRWAGDDEETSGEGGVA